MPEAISTRILARVPGLPLPAALPPLVAPVRKTAPAGDRFQLSPAAKAAREAARQVAVFPGPAEVADGSFRRVEQDPRSANAHNGLDRMYDASAAKARTLPAPTTTREAQAKALTALQLPLANQVVNNWSDSIRDLRYSQLRELVAEDPFAVLALQSLLISGQLEATAPPASDGKPLFHHLVSLLKAPLAPGIDRAKLVGDLIQEVSEPGCIAQQQRSTCTVTSMQIMLVKERPAEYARLVAGLAGSGAVRTFSGAVLVRDDVDPAKCGRTQSAALFQAACMELANGDDDYIDATDESGPESTVIKGLKSRGLGPEPLKKALGAVMGGEWRHMPADTTAQGGLMAITAKPGTPKPAEVLAELKKNTDAGRCVVTALTWADDMKDPRAALSGHAILVTGVREGRVFYNNPHGAQESMAEADFLGRVTGIFPKQVD